MRLFQGPVLVDPRDFKVSWQVSTLGRGPLGLTAAAYPTPFKSSPGTGGNVVTHNLGGVYAKKDFLINLHM